MNCIAAVDENWNIGNQNKLLFHIHQDMCHFRQLTNQQTVLMGRKTFESIGKPLPGRTNLVLTRQPGYYQPGVTVIHNIHDLNLHDPHLWCIGGASLYKNLLPFCDKIYLTKIFAAKSADAAFPNLDRDFTDLYQITETSPILEENDLKFCFVTYEKIGRSQASDLE